MQNQQNDIQSGSKLRLRPARPEDKKKVFEWLTNSNLTSEMLGKPKYPEAKIPTWEEFDDDYLDYYFDGTAPLKGRCFIIIEGETEIGQVNYNEINKVTRTTDLDIWLSDKMYIGKGLGTEALKLLCDHLFKRYQLAQINICPSARNEFAIRSYLKAGFILTDVELEESEKDYTDNVVMILKNRHEQNHNN